MQPGRTIDHNDSFPENPEQAPQKTQPLGTRLRKRHKQPEAKSQRDKRAAKGYRQRQRKRYEFLENQVTELEARIKQLDAENSYLRDPADQFGHPVSVLF